MKKLIFCLYILSFAFVLTFNFSCKDKSNKEGKEYTSEYVCPMHCEGSGSDSPGICPACGMDYEINKERSIEGSKDSHHDHNHDGHNHDHGDHDHSH